VRYFEEPEDESSKLRRTVCKNCGAKGDHKTADCRVLIVSKFVFSRPYIHISYKKLTSLYLQLHCACVFDTLVFDMWRTR